MDAQQRQEGVPGKKGATVMMLSSAPALTHACQ
jgi:hypothetical protein